MKPVTFFAAAAVAMMPAAAFAATVTAPTYVKMAGASDLFEKQSSALVEDSQNPKIVEYAKMMIAHHTKSTNDVVAAAQADGLTPSPPALMPKQEAMIAQLTKVTGTKRDALYVKQQVASHKEALALQQGYAKSGDKPSLKAAAATIVPVVQQHLTEVQGMKMK